MNQYDHKGEPLLRSWLSFEYLSRIFIWVAFAFVDEPLWKTLMFWCIMALIYHFVLIYSLFRDGWAHARLRFFNLSWTLLNWMFIINIEHYQTNSVPVYGLPMVILPFSRKLCFTLLIPSPCPIDIDSCHATVQRFESENKMNIPSWWLITTKFYRFCSWFFFYSVSHTFDASEIDDVWNAWLQDLIVPLSFFFCLKRKSSCIFSLFWSYYSLNDCFPCRKLSRRN